MIKILAIPGSLRENSSSNLILKEIISLAPAGVVIEVYEGVGTLPHFNDPAEVPDIVVAFRQKIKDADAILICTPEYAFGIPGSLKNALDWTVSSGDFVDKEVGLITASSQGEKGHAAMLLVLTAISSRVIEEACLLISFVRAKLNTSGKIKEEQLMEDLKKAIQNLAMAAQKN